jgi:hypothetical protein
VALILPEVSVPDPEALRQRLMRARDRHHK